jgi:putative ABC transport system permease protein
MAGSLRVFFSRVRALFAQKKAGSELDEELATHIDLLTEKFVSEGMPRSDAAEAARRQFGNATLLREKHREGRSFLFFSVLGRDLSFSARLLRKSPGFTAVALITLALGVGANTTVFSMINGLLLRPLNVPASSQLAVIGIDQGGPRINYSLPEPLFRGLERRHDSFSQVFAFFTSPLQVKGASGTENIPAQMVSGDFFSALETAPLLGRTLTPQDDRKGGDPAGFGVVISEHFWETWFSRTPDVIGRKLNIDNTVFTVVGVMPRRFFGAEPLNKPDLFVPLATEPVLNKERSITTAGFHAWWLVVMGRLQPGVTVDEASARVASQSRAILEENVPDAKWVDDQTKHHFRFEVESGSTGFTYLRMEFRKPLLAVLAMCGGILLLACLNLASLLMARGAARQRELATRLAMGASRRRLVQQLMVESMMLAVLGTALGLAISPLVGESLSALLLSGQKTLHIDTSLDLRVFGFSALVAVGATLLMGLVPALQATSSSLHAAIKEGQNATQAHERRKILPRVLLSIEVALAMMLVVGAGLLASSLVRLYTSGAGFDPRGVENIAFSMDKEGLKGDALMQFYRTVGEGLSRQPGVKNVSFARIVPLQHFIWDEDMSVSTAKSIDVDLNSVGPDYFAAMRIPLLVGREFKWDDNLASGRRIILNQTAARIFFPGGNAVGQSVNMREDKTPESYLVVGVSGDAKYEDMCSPAPPAAYVPMTQTDPAAPESFTAVVRVDGPAGPLPGAARALAMKWAPAIPAPEMTSMMEVIDDSLNVERMMALLSVFFALCALMVTTVGLYGTLAYATARRTSEIGIRMALGAQRAQVMRLVFFQNAAVAITGTAVGLGAALLASRALQSFLYGTSTRDPLVYAASIAALAAIASAASLVPALRAARIEPMKAIRCE